MACSCKWLNNSMRLMSQEAITVAREESERYNVTELLQYEVANLNLLEFTLNSYGAIRLSISASYRKP